MHDPISIQKDPLIRSNVASSCSTIQLVIDTRILPPSSYYHFPVPQSIEASGLRAVYSIKKTDVHRDILTDHSLVWPVHLEIRPLHGFRFMSCKCNHGEATGDGQYPWKDGGCLNSQVSSAWCELGDDGDLTWCKLGRGSSGFRAHGLERLQSTASMNGPSRATFCGNPVICAVFAISSEKLYHQRSVLQFVSAFSARYLPSVVLMLGQPSESSIFNLDRMAIHGPKRRSCTFNSDVPGQHLTPVKALSNDEPCCFRLPVVAMGCHGDGSGITIPSCSCAYMQLNLSTSYAYSAGSSSGPSYDSNSGIVKLFSHDGRFTAKERGRIIDASTYVGWTFRGVKPTTSQC
ncbi:uncharacterized protein ARMOST_21803 [Armillaria ostoyae]|uniref:Uncharacterized protein n=1 Tax=Armillaria ostoyae TaxID=47428 RepID=A0A284SB58_ARMOS|nr:uncharacterized protein ARMOST_21803 [Armillaria ostoyae]